MAGRYRVTEVLRRGPAGDVVGAVDAQTGVDVALKRIPAAGQDVGRRVRQIAASLAHVRHPLLASVLDVKETRGDLWVVSDRVWGRPLLPWWGSLPLHEHSSFEERWHFAGPLLAGLCAALDALHVRNLAHLDVKPANILVDPSGRPTLVDLGLPGARPLTEPTRGELEERFGYLAPEMLDGLAISRRADQFQLGAVLYRLLTGQRAVTGMDAAELRRSYGRGRVPPPREWRPDLPADVERVLMRLLAWDPDDRFDSLSDLRTALADHLPGQPAPAWQPWTEPAPPVVGRDPLAAFFRKRLIELKAGQGAVIRLEGAPGCGKSTMLAQWAEQARAEGDLRIELASCEPNAAIAVLRPWFEPPPVDVQGPPPSDLVEQALAELRGPTVLLLDGLELLDPVAWARVHRVAAAAAMGSARLLVVLAGQTIPALEPRIPGGHDRVFNVELPALTAADVRSLLLPESDGADDLEVAEAAAESYRDQAGGNPGALVDVLLREAGSGTLSRVGRHFRLGAIGDQRPSLGLPPAMPQFLAWLRALGEPVELELLMTCLPFDRGTILSCIAYGRQEGYLRWSRIAGRWRVSGGAQAASTTTELYGVPVVHARAARWLELNVDEDGAAGERVAQHWRQGSDSVRAAAAYRRAADAHAIVGSTSEARRLLGLVAAFRRR